MCTTDECDTITIIEKPMLNIRAWMDAVRLKLNESKTEFIYFGSRQQLAKCQEKIIKVVRRKFNFATWYAILEAT